MSPTHQRAVLLLVALLAGLWVSDAATQFTLPKKQVLSCSDSKANVCTAPTSCNKLGEVSFDPGQNFNVGPATATGGLWTIVGGYNITFPSDCNVTCQGDCTCASCTKIEVASISTADGASSSSSTSNLAPVVRVLSLVLLSWSAWVLL